MKLLEDAGNCCGCGTCRNACPRDCISMQLDAEGFLYPMIEQQLCIECGRCLDVCPANREDLPQKPQRCDVYAAWNKDSKVRQESSSGGVFTALATHVLQNNGVVFGASFDKNNNLTHCMVENGEGLAGLRGSKYIQSDMLLQFREAKRQLDWGKPVLFCGTPCQVAGLKTYLGADCERLYLCDFVCHGVPSTKVFQRYCEHIKENSDIISLYFRDKKTGWKRFGMHMEFNGRPSYCSDLKHDPFLVGFLSNLFLRPSCHRCRYTTAYRGSDITLGDFWGIGSKAPRLDDDRGTSLVIINTEKGKEIFNRCKEDLVYHESDLELAIDGNACLARHAQPSPLREQFFKDLDKMAFGDLAKTYLQPPSESSLLLRALSKTKSHLRRLIGR